jgi:hypothetical protein
MRPILVFFVMIIALTAGATALATKYSPDTASYVAAGGLALGLGILVAMAGEVRSAARSLWRR